MDVIKFSLTLEHLQALYECSQGEEFMCWVISSNIVERHQNFKMLGAPLGTDFVITNAVFNFFDQYIEFATDKSFPESSVTFTRRYVESNQHGDLKMVFKNGKNVDLTGQRPREIRVNAMISLIEQFPEAKTGKIEFVLPSGK